MVPRVWPCDSPAVRKRKGGTSLRRRGACGSAFFLTRRVVSRCRAVLRLDAAGAAFLPPEPAAFAVLLDAFMLDKAFYELVYELNNRPDWVRIPLRGVLELLRG